MTTKSDASETPEGWWSRRTVRSANTRASARLVDEPYDAGNRPHDGSSALSDSSFVALERSQRERTATPIVLIPEYWSYSISVGPQGSTALLLTDETPGASKA